jgi:hypothetical protein
MGDWLGTGAVATWSRKYKSFKKARAFVRRLALNSTRKWINYCKSGKKPHDIPADPSRVYADDGWRGLGDWLGTGRIANQSRDYRSFKDALSFTRRLALRSRNEWIEYCGSGKKPDDIPAKPPHVYANEGWAGWGDWTRDPHGSCDSAKRMRPLDCGATTGQVRLASTFPFGNRIFVPGTFLAVAVHGQHAPATLRRCAVKTSTRR